MKLEIKTKCAVCGIKVDHYVGPGDACYRYLCIQPCPTCHPAKVEKVTPGKGKTVEVRDKVFGARCFNTRVATGTRSEAGLILVYNLILSCPAIYYDQWRYPGETEWRD